MSDKVILTCAINGILTSPDMGNIPVTPEQMADAARQAWDQGASIVHCRFRDQRPGMSMFPTWDVDVVKSIIQAIRERVPGVIISQSTGVPGLDISGPLACLEAVRPEIAACNAGSINFLRLTSNGSWAWPPWVFDNSVEKIQMFLDVMAVNNVVPEFECFDSGILRSVELYRKTGMFDGNPHISLVMGLPSGMPAKPEWVPLLKNEMPENSHWQVICVGRQEVWDVHRKAVEEGGNARTGLEDGFYLPDGRRARGNGELVEALAEIVRETGREIASADEARQILGLKTSDGEMY